MVDSKLILKEEGLLGLRGVIRGRSLLRGPYHIEIQITDRCNANCYFCNQRELNIGQKEMPFYCLKKILLDLCKRGLRSIRLSGGGEPTTHTEILEILDFIYHLQLRINFFNTNGILLTPQISQKLIQCKLEILQVSINSSHPKTWAKINGCREIYYYKVLENIRNFIHYDRDRSVCIIGSFILDELTHKELPAMYELCKNLDIEFQIKDLNCYTYSHYFRASCLSIFMKDLFNLISPDNINNFMFLNLTNLYVFLKIIRTRFSKATTILPCFAPWVSALVRAGGNVYPCCALGARGHILGNIFKRSFIDIWRGEKFENLRFEYKDAMFKNLQEISKSKHRYFQYFEKYNFLNCPVKSMFYHLCSNGISKVDVNKEHFFKDSIQYDEDLKRLN